MSKPITHNKRDNEKKKQEKRIEKQKRKEQRKLSGTDSFDDMIAYVDENGVISSTPPEYNKTENADTSRNIIPEKRKPAPEQHNTTVAIKGRVEYINAEKGYGFVKEITRTDKYFFHVSGLLESVQVDDIVVFDLERGKKGFNAVRIKKQM